MLSKLLLKSLICLSFIAIISSCSVMMAAKKEGTNIDKVQACRTRGQFLSYGPVIVNSERMPTGELVETYQYQKERGSAVRALMHGVLDVSTCGVWEVVGTPIEACIDEKSYFSIKVYYDEQEIAQKIELV